MLEIKISYFHLNFENGLNFLRSSVTRTNVVYENTYVGHQPWSVDILYTLENFEKKRKLCMRSILRDRF